MVYVEARKTMAYHDPIDGEGRIEMFGACVIDYQFWGGQAVVPSVPETPTEARIAVESWV